MRLGSGMMMMVVVVVGLLADMLLFLVSLRVAKMALRRKPTGVATKV